MGGQVTRTPATSQSLARMDLGLQAVVPPCGASAFSSPEGLRKDWNHPNPLQEAEARTALGGTYPVHGDDRPLPVSVLQGLGVQLKARGHGYLMPWAPSRGRARQQAQACDSSMSERNQQQASAGTSFQRPSGVQTEDPVEKSWSLRALPPPDSRCLHPRLSWGPSQRALRPCTLLPREPSLPSGAHARPGSPGGWELSCSPNPQHHRGLHAARRRLSSRVGDTLGSLISTASSGGGGECVI